MTDAERNYVLHEAAQAVCPKCAAGDVPEFQADPAPDYWHEAERCRASRILCLRSYA